MPLTPATADGANNPISLTNFLDNSFGSNGSFSLKDTFGPNPLNDSDDYVGPVTVDRIAIDSQDRIVVLASFYDFDTYADNHILFRLNPNGTYDNSFAPSGPSLRKDVSDSRKHYVLVATTGPPAHSPDERVDLEIAPGNKILVMLSVPLISEELDVSHHNFIARYSEYGVLDLSFAGGDGVIGSFGPQQGIPLTLFEDFTVDPLGNIVVTSLYSDPGPFAEVVIERYTSAGLLDENFGRDEFGETDLQIIVPSAQGGVGLYGSKIIADNSGGYLVASTGVANFGTGAVLFTHLIRLNSFGEIMDTDFGYGGPFLPSFYLTDLFPDGSGGDAGFIMSGTFIEDQFGLAKGVVIRLKLNGDFDTIFSNGALNQSTVVVSNSCLNSALLRNNRASQSQIGVLVGNKCITGSAGLKAFKPGTQDQADFSLEDTGVFELALITQLEATTTGKVVALSGARPTKGLTALQFLEASDSWDWTNATISRYQIPSIPISAPTITEISPPSGSTAGATAITVTGINFLVGATVSIGGAVCTNVVVVTSTRITCTTPAGSAGAKNVVVTNTDTGTTTFTNGFTYNAPTTASYTPVLSYVSTYDYRFTVQVTNYDAAFTYTVSTTAGQATINSTGLVTVTGLSVDQSATVTVTTTRVGYAAGSASVTGRSQVAPMLPTGKPLLSVSAASIMCTMGTYSATPTSAAFSLFVDGKHVSTSFSSTGENLPDWIIPWATSSSITRTATLTSATWAMSDSYKGKSVTCSTLAYSKHAIGLTASETRILP